jgi:hypothetical protein
MKINQHHRKGKQGVDDAGPNRERDKGETK